MKKCYNINMKSMFMSVKNIIEQQGWEKQKIKEDGAVVYQFDDDPDTLKIFLADNEDISLDELKNKLWNTYYSRILVYKQNLKYKVWINNQNPKNMGKDFDEKSFDEKVSPIEYWDKYITKNPKNTVDKKLEESVLAVFNNLKNKYSGKEDDLISIILVCTFVRFLEDRMLTDIEDKLIDSLASKQLTVDLFKKYNSLHNGMLFKRKTLYNLDEQTRNTLKSFLEDNMADQKSFFSFNFKYIPIELISNIYEKLLTEKLGKEQKKNQGIAYTPPKLAGYLTKEAFKQLDKSVSKKDFSNIKVADLSAGSGIFLVLAFRELLKRAPKNISFEQKKKILEKSFYGIDLDKSAVNITTFSLYVELLGNKEERLASSNKFPILKNIKPYDALSYDQEDSFFDLVIGNPPWGSKPDYFKIIKNEKFAQDIANKESAQIFVNLGIKKLKNHGILALVLPSAGFYNSTAFSFRKSLFDNMTIKEFVDFSPIRNHIFDNHVETSIIIGKKESYARSYNIPMRRAINEADYLYFNHISGDTHNIDSNFLQSRKDAWQIAVRGGNMAAFFINRLTKNNITLGDAIKNITTGYQGSLVKYTNKKIKKTISESRSDFFSTPIIYDPDKKYYCAKTQKASPSHKLLDKIFIDNNCLIIYKKYKFNKANRLPVTLKQKNVSFSEYFIGINPDDKKLLYFLSALLSSRMVMFFINITAATVPLLSNEQKNPKLYQLDVKKIPFPKEYSQFINIIKIGQKLVDNNFSNLAKLQNIIDTEVENMFQVDNLEKNIIKQWERTTKRKNIDTHHARTKSYQSGFEHMLNNYNLPKPKQWGSKIINGVEIISFSNTAKQPEMNNKIKQKINDIVIAKREMVFEFINNDQGIIIRREKNNQGFLTGLSDAESILSSL